jgi:hypothetical protein
VLVGGEGLRSAPGTVEGEHQQGVQVLAQRVSAGEALQFGNQRSVAAQVQVGVDTRFHGLQPHFREPGLLS